MFGNLGRMSTWTGGDFPVCTVSDSRFLTPGRWVMIVIFGPNLVPCETPTFFFYPLEETHLYPVRGPTYSFFLVRTSFVGNLITSPFDSCT